MKIMNASSFSFLLARQYQTYFHGNIKATSIAMSRLPWQYQGYSHGNIKATSIAISRLLPWQYQTSVAMSRLLPFHGNIMATSINQFLANQQQLSFKHNNNHIPAFSTIFVSLKKTKHLKRQI